MTLVDEFRKWCEQTIYESDRDFQEYSDLWTILTALRGPDSGDEKLKSATTALIREKVCPKLASDVGAFVGSGDTQEYAELRGTLPCWGHFGAHAFQAFGVLGLNWYGVSK